MEKFWQNVLVDLGSIFIMDYSYSELRSLNETQNGREEEQDLTFRNEDIIKISWNPANTVTYCTLF